MQIYKERTKLLTKSTQQIGKNLSELGLNLTPAKTKFMHFNNQKILPGETELEIAGVCIKSSEQVKFLGVIFDYNMSFVPQLNYIQQRCYKSLNIIKFLCGTWWGSDPETLTTLYKCYTRSIIDYSCFVWFRKF